MSTFGPRLLVPLLLAIPIAAQPPVELRFDEGTLTIDAHTEPIADGTYRIWEQPELRERFDLTPATASKTHELETLRAFLPDEPVRVGDTWKLPPSAWLPMVRQICSDARARMRHGNSVPGAYACLRAVSATHAEIELRVHADFVLADGKAFMTPAQFAGRLLVDRQRHAPVALDLALPVRNSNAVILARVPTGGIADEVFVPRMELTAGEAPDEIAWDEEIPVEEARERLAHVFYRFVDIEWVAFDGAEAEAKRQEKPLHVMVLFGALDDESC